MGMAPANAAPPSARAASPMQQPHQAPAASLDLRAPVLEAEQQPSNLFPSLTHRDDTGVSDLTTFNLGQSEAGEMHGPPSMTELALRVRREGLPLVRLWQGNSALVHLGLNAKGKPGLWLLQKTH
jgi:hypothetical protein